MNKYENPAVFSQKARKGRDLVEWLISSDSSWLNNTIWGATCRTPTPAKKQWTSLPTVEHRRASHIPAVASQSASRNGNSRNRGANPFSSNPHQAAAHVPFLLPISTRRQKNMPGEMFFLLQVQPSPLVAQGDIFHSCRQHQQDPAGVHADLEQQADQNRAQNTKLSVAIERFVPFCGH